MLRLAVATAVLLAIVFVGIASASASSSIEGVWSFNGGKVDIQHETKNTFEGIVVAPTTFAQCTHTEGEPMWTKMTLQPDGTEYWGLHQWFYETPECSRNPKLGPTAWRIVETANGDRFLRVCFSSPEDPAQPVFTASGEVSGDSYGCVGSEVESGKVASLPVVGGSTSSTGVESFQDAVSLPGNKQCLSRRIFRIHLKDPSYDPLKTVVVTLGKRRVAVRRHGNVFAAIIDLKGLPAGTFTVRIRVTTVLGHHLYGSRTYHTCVARRKASRPKSLKRAVTRRPSAWPSSR
jgi:hypothetical protein